MFVVNIVGYEQTDAWVLFDVARVAIGDMVRTIMICT